MDLFYMLVGITIFGIMLAVWSVAPRRGNSKFAEPLYRIRMRSPR